MLPRLAILALALSTSVFDLSAATAQTLEVGGAFPGEQINITSDADYAGMVIGGNDAGDIGTLIISNGAKVTSTVAYPNAGLTLGGVAGTSGLLRVEGSGTTLTVNETTLIGTDGVGQLQVIDGARLETVRLVIDDPSGGSSLVLRGEGTTWHNAGGGIQVSRGELAVLDGADLTLTETGLYVSGGGSVTISGPGSSYVATIVNPEMGPSFNMDGGEAVFSDGARIVTASGYIGVGNSATPASLTVTGQGTTWDTYSWLYVGGANGGTGDGDGTLVISDGAKVTGRSLGVGMDSDSTGLLVLTGAGSSLSARTIDTVGGNLYVAYAGEGELVVADGASLDVENEIRIAYDTGSSYGRLVVGGREGEEAVGAGAVSARKLVFGDGSNGSIYFNHTDVDYEFDLTVEGSGAIYNKAGQTRLSGDSPDFAGNIFLEGGLLQIDGDYSGAVLNGTAGTLGGTGALNTVNLGAEATHEVAGAAIGTQNVVEGYHNFGTLVVDLDATGSDQIIADRYWVDAQIKLRAGPDLQGSVFERDYILVDQTGSNPGQGSPDVSDLGPFIDGAVSLTGGDGNDLVLHLTRNATSFASIGVTANQRAVAEAADSVPGSAAYNLVALSADEDMARFAYDQLSGEIHADMRAGFVSNSRFVRDTMNQRLMVSGGEAEETGDLGYWPGLDLPFDQVLASPSAEIWGTLYGSRGNFVGDGNATSLDTISTGLLMGIEGADGDWRLGLSAGVGAQSFATGQRSTGDSADLQLGAYAGARFGATGLRLGGNLAAHGIETSRTVTVSASEETLEGRYFGLTGQLFAEVDHEIDLGATRLLPFANASYVGTPTTAFSETGGSMALDAAAGSSNTLLTVLGLRSEADLQLGEKLVTLSGMLGWQHALGDVNGSSSNSFGGSAFTVSGTGIAEDALLFDLGISAELAPNSTVSAGYRSEFSETGRSETLFGRFQQAF